MKANLIEYFRVVLTLPYTYDMNFTKRCICAFWKTFQNWLAAVRMLDLAARDLSNKHARVDNKHNV